MPKPKRVIHHHQPSFAILFGQSSGYASKTVFAGLRNVIASQVKHMALEFLMAAIRRESKRYDAIERRCQTLSVCPRRKTVSRALLLLEREGEATTDSLMAGLSVSETTAQQLMRLIPRVQRQMVLAFGGRAPVTPLVLSEEEVASLPY